MSSTCTHGLRHCQEDVLRDSDAGPWLAVIAWAGATLLCLGHFGGQLNAADLQVHRSPHVILQTDADPNAARAALQEIETVFDRCEAYWDRPMTGRVRCFFVADLHRWQSFTFPEPTARVVLERVGGGTKLEAGTTAEPAPQAVIYATDAPKVLQHEAVHAYCFQVFGHAGPDWYREGMAEVIAQGSRSAGAVSCREGALERLQTAPSRSLAEITGEADFSNTLKRSVIRQLDDAQASELALQVQHPSTVGRWNERDGAALEQAQLDYARSWAVCYFLTQHRGYRDRFRCFGKQLLQGGRVELAEFFAGTLDRMNFEFAQFQDHLQPGYRLDLCHWQWNDSAKDRHLAAGQHRTIPIRAALGFQATGIVVDSSHAYRLTFDGAWRTRDPMGAEDKRERNQIEVVVLNNFELSSPETFTQQATWDCAQSGQLYVRCLDGWGELGDNHGTLLVHIERTR